MCGGIMTGQAVGMQLKGFGSLLIALLCGSLTVERESLEFVICVRITAAQPKQKK